MASYRTTVMGTSGLVAYWRLGEASGLTAVDELGLATATYFGNPILGTPGPLADGNTGATFDGAGDYARTAGFRLGAARPLPTATTPLDVGDNVTMEAWLKLAALGGGYRGVVSKGQGAWYFRVNGGTGQVELVQSRVAVSAVSTTNLPAGGWHHVACTKAGATNRIYIDGLDRTGTVTNATFTDNDETVTIAGDTYPGDVRELFAGALDEVAVYNRALSASEVLAHYNAAGQLDPSLGRSYAVSGGVL